MPEKAVVVVGEVGVLVREELLEFDGFDKVYMLD